MHRHRGSGSARAALDAIDETALPRLLAMLCVLAVFVPAFFMTGAARALFMPLALAVGISMAASYVLSSTLLPVLSVWWASRGEPRVTAERESLLALLVRPFVRLTVATALGRRFFRRLMRASCSSGSARRPEHGSNGPSRSRSAFWR